MKEGEMNAVGGFIDTVLRNIGKTQVYASVAAEVEHLCLQFPLYPELQG
jgi:glycine/serine hydroxymethyltransferase